MAPSKMYSSILLALATLLTLSAATKSKSEIGPKKILVFLPLPAPSHHNIFSALTDALLERGHYVTIVSPRAQKTKFPRQREIMTNDPFEEVFSNMTKDFFKGPKNIIQNILMMTFIGPLMTKEIFANPKVMALKDEHFDLVITETFFFQESLLGFAHHYGCPSLSLNPFGYSMHLNELTGGATSPAYVPNVFGSAVKPETLWDRVVNTFTSLLWMANYHLYYYPHANSELHKAFPNAPPLYDLIKNISLTLINNNNALMHAVPLAPSVIEVGGLHIKAGKPLPADLRKWIEESKDGIVYFSLGSNLKANELPQEKKDVIFGSFAKLKQRVLVKWNGEVPANAPKNCRFEEWVPQQEVLSHPNLKVFVTHGGLLSTQESVYFGAAVIGMPVFGDQFMNMEMATRQGFAVKVSIFDLTTKDFDDALDEVISNPKYREKSQELSVLFKLDPTPSLEKAVYYTEQLIKIGNFKHLQPSSVNLSWYQYMLLDVMAVFAVGLYVTWKVLCFVLRTCCGCFCRSSKAKKE